MLFLKSEWKSVFWVRGASVLWRRGAAGRVFYSRLVLLQLLHFTLKLLIGLLRLEEERLSQCVMRTEDRVQA